MTKRFLLVIAFVIGLAFLLIAKKGSADTVKRECYLETYRPILYLSNMCPRFTVMVGKHPTGVFCANTVVQCVY